MMIKREPIRKSTVASAMALYGTLGGLLLNCKGRGILHLKHFLQLSVSRHNHQKIKPP